MYRGLLDERGLSTTGIWALTRPPIYPTILPFATLGLNLKPIKNVQCVVAFRALQHNPTTGGSSGLPSPTTEIVQVQLLPSVINWFEGVRTIPVRINSAEMRGMSTLEALMCERELISGFYAALTQRGVSTWVGISWTLSRISCLRIPIRMNSAEMRGMPPLEGAHVLEGSDVIFLRP